MNVTCRKQLNECQDKKKKQIIVQLVDHIYILANRTILLNINAYIPVDLFTVWSLAPKVKKSNVIAMNLK